MITRLQISHPFTNTFHDSESKKRKEGLKHKIKFEIKKDAVVFQMEMVLAYPPASWPKIRGNRGVCPCKTYLTLSAYVQLYLEYHYCLQIRTIDYLGFPEVDISVAEWGEQDLQTNFISLWWSYLNFLYHQRLSGFPCHRSCNAAFLINSCMIKVISWSHITFF